MTMIWHGLLAGAGIGSLLVALFVLGALVARWRRPRFDAPLPPGVRTRSPLSRAQRRRHRKRRR